MHFRKKGAQINFNPKGGGQDMSGFKFSYQIITSGFELIENLRFVWKTSGILSVLLGWSKAYFSTYTAVLPTLQFVYLVKLVTLIQ